MNLGSSWRPPEWVNPYWDMPTTETPSRDRYKSERQKGQELALQAAYEAGASAIVMPVREATLREVGERLNKYWTKAPIYSGGRDWVHLWIPKEDIEAFLRGEMPGKEVK